MSEDDIKKIMSPLFDDSPNKCDDWNNCKDCAMKFQVCRISRTRFFEEYMEYLRDKYE